MTAPSQDPFFKSIGSLAEDTDQLPDEGEVADATKEASGQPDEERPIHEIESLCMRCGENGVTRMMLTSIPYFREVILASFRCEHCGEQNNEIQSAGPVRDQGTLYTAKILNRSDLDRQLVKSSTCTVSIPEFELTIPPKTGSLTTVEGILQEIITDLSIGQPLRRIQDEATYEKLEALLTKLRASLGVNEAGDAVDTSGAVVEGERKGDEPTAPFTLKLDDPTGNSWIEFLGDMSDPKWSLKTYDRSKEQNDALGFAVADGAGAAEEKPGAAHAAKVHKIEHPNADALEALRTTHTTDDDDEQVRLANEEIFVFPGTCSSCKAPLDTLMKKVQIPYFKDILIMSTNCDKCGYRDNEIKSGSAISEKGKRITLKVEDADDLARDILKSESCGLEIPEIQLVLQPGTLGGRFTTLEGLLSQVYDELSTKAFARGDAADAKDGRSAFEVFLGKLKAVMSAEIPFTVILDDPLADSYLQNIYAPDPDPNMSTETYERTYDQNEDLGLNDMKVEGYEEDAETKPEETAAKDVKANIPAAS